MPKINQDRTTVFMIEEAGKTWTLTRDTHIRIAGPGQAVHETFASSDTELTLHGVIWMDTSTSAAVLMEGARTSVHLTQTGTINGNVGVSISGVRSKVLNEGTITADNICLSASGIRSTVTNAGTLIGDYGVVLAGSDAVFVNEQDGSVLADIGVAVLGNSSTVTKIVNKSYIYGEGLAVRGDLGLDTVINKGSIDGNVDLGGGDDVFDGRSGSLTGTVIGGAGSDDYITSDGSLAIVEAADEGSDWVRSSVSFALQDNIEFLTLTGTKNLNGVASATGSIVKGNAGNNILVGQGAQDQLDGGKGKDRLTGGSDSDSFVFLKGYDTDTIVDFGDGDDLLNILGFKNADSYSEIKRLMSDHGDDVWITFGGGDKLILKAIAKSELLEDHFTFAA